MNHTAVPASTLLERKPLTPALARLLENACRAERAATGINRRGAFRNTRSIIGASLAAGFAPKDVAAILGVTVGSTLARRQANGRLTVASARALLEMSAPELDAAPLVVRAGDDYSGPYYRAADITAFLSAEPNHGTQPRSPGERAQPHPTRSTPGVLSAASQPTDQPS